jgi:hypothetical protein
MAAVGAIGVGVGIVKVRKVWQETPKKKIVEE